MESYDLGRRVAAEGLGTAILVATVVGSGIMAETLTKDVALALLGNTLPTGAILVVLITVSDRFQAHISSRTLQFLSRRLRLRPHFGEGSLQEGKRQTKRSR